MLFPVAASVCRDLVSYRSSKFLVVSIEKPSKEQKKAGFAQIPNSVFNDKRLSYRALGLLAYLLSKPPNWNPVMAELRKERKERKDAVRAAVAELEKLGYLTKTPKRAVAGRVNGWAYRVTNAPTERPGPTGG